MMLKDLLVNGQQAIAATSTLIGMGMFPQTLDATGVDTLTDEQIEALFSAIPQDWDFTELAQKVFDEPTLEFRLITGV